MTEFPRCKTCNWWVLPEKDEHDKILFPEDPDTLQPMPQNMLIPVRICRHPQQTFCERPVEENGFGLADGSEYRANLYTAAEFGCVRHEPILEIPTWTAALTTPT